MGCPAEEEEQELVPLVPLPTAYTETEETVEAECPADVVCANPGDGTGVQKLAANKEQPESEPEGMDETEEEEVESAPLVPLLAVYADGDATPPPPPLHALPGVLNRGRSSVRRLEVADREEGSDDDAVYVYTPLSERVRSVRGGNRSASPPRRSSSLLADSTNNYIRTPSLSPEPRQAHIAPAGGVVGQQNEEQVPVLADNYAFVTCVDQYGREFQVPSGMIPPGMVPAVAMMTMDPAFDGNFWNYGWPCPYDVFGDGEAAQGQEEPSALVLASTPVAGDDGGWETASESELPL